MNIISGNLNVIGSVVFGRMVPIVEGGTPIVANSTLPDGLYGVSYDYDFTAQENIVGASVQVLGGSLPPGLSLNSGVLTGTPTGTSNITYHFTLEATNGTRVVSQDFVMHYVYSAPPEFLDTSLAYGQHNVAYTSLIRAVGSAAGGNVTTSLVAGTLPAGLVINDYGSSAYLAITGTPSSLSGGTYPLTFQATNNFGSTEEILNLFLLAPPAWSPSGIDLANLTPSYASQNVQFTGSSTDGLPVSYQLVGGTYSSAPSGYVYFDDQLPPNMTLDTSTGIISGPVNPYSNSTIARYWFSVQAIDGGTVNTLTTKQYYIQIDTHQSPDVSITRSTYNSSIPSSTAGYYLSGDTLVFSISATVVGGFPITFTANSSSAAIPTGMTFADHGNGTATFSGTIDPSVGNGDYSFIFDANDGFFTTTKTIPFVIYQLTTPDWNNVYNGGDLSSALVATTTTGNPASGTLILADQVYASSQGAAFFNQESATGGVGGSANNMVTTNASGYLGRFALGNGYYSGGNGYGSVDFPLTLSVVSGTLPPGITLYNYPVQSVNSQYLGGHFWCLKGQLEDSSFGKDYTFTIRATLTNEAISYHSDQTFTASIPYVPPQYGSGPAVVGGTFTVGHATTGSSTFTVIDPNSLTDTLTFSSSLPTGWSANDNGNNTLTLHYVDNSNNHAGDTYAVSLSADNGYQSNSWSFTLRLT